MLIAARESFAAVASRRRLPYDSRVEYLQSSGTQYIDTGYTSNHRDEVISAVINNFTDVTKNQAIFGVSRKGLLS